MYSSVLQNYPSLHQIPFLNNSYVVYEYPCPGCSQKYIGKTETTLCKRTKEHGWQQKDSAVLGHFKECDGWHLLPKCLNAWVKKLIKKKYKSTMYDEILKFSRSDNWLKLAFLESLAIKEHRPPLNTGIKATQELCLF